MPTAIQWDGQWTTHDLIFAEHNNRFGAPLVLHLERWTDATLNIRGKRVAFGEWVVFSDTGVHHCRLQDGLLHGIDGYTVALKDVKDARSADKQVFVDLICHECELIGRAQAVIREAASVLNGGGR